MSETALTGGESVLPRARNDRQTPAASTPAEAPATASTRRPVRPFRFLSTMGAADFRGLDIDITPTEISEDLDYGRD